MKITPIQVPDEMRRQLGGRVVVHSILYSRSTIAPGLFDPEHERELAPVRQALVRANPVNGRKNIYIGSHAWYIEGMDPGESRRLLETCWRARRGRSASTSTAGASGTSSCGTTAACCTVGGPWDARQHKRVMRRTTIAGQGPTAEPPLATRTTVWEGIIAPGVGG